MVGVFFANKMIATILLYIGSGLLTFLPFVIYMYIFVISTGDVRKQALIIILGMILSALGQFGGAILFENSVFDRTNSQIFGFTLSLIGLGILSYGFSKGITSSMENT